MAIPQQCRPIAGDVKRLESQRNRLQAGLTTAGAAKKPVLAARLRRVRRKLKATRLELAQCIEANTPAPADTGVLSGGGTIGIDQSLVAPGGASRLTFQSDGNLVLYCKRADGWVPRWSTDTWGRTVTTCVMQTDGNLVLYNNDDPVWSSNTWTFPGSRLVVQEDENVVIYQGDTPIWATGTSLDGTPIKGPGPEVYHLIQGVRRWIPDGETLEARFGGWARVTVLPDAQLQRWPKGEPEPSVLGATLPVVKICLDKPVTGPPLPDRGGQQAPPRILPDGSVVGTTRQPLAGETAKMWDVGATVRVKMMGGTAKIRGKVREYAEQWTQYANIHFAFVDDNAHIKVAFDPGGSWSNVGRDALGVPFDYATMNYGWFTDDTAESEFSRVILHEFGHALGLIHEHQSPAAGIAWDREKTYEYFTTTQGWSRGEVDANVFDRYAVSQTNYSAFDPNSIMEYSIPAELTLDGKGVTGGTALSPTDIEYIRRWYPFPPTPANAQGLLRTGDDCDEIDFVVEYGVIGGDNVDFQLQPAGGLTWWKAIEVPTGAGGYRMLQMQDGRSDGATLARAEIDVSRPMRFWKAKAFGVHTKLSYTWDILTALPAGSRLTLRWKRDRC